MIQFDDLNFETEYNNTIAEAGYIEERIILQDDKVGYFIVKRLLDIVIAFIAGVILLIPSLVIVLAIKFTMPGKILYLQERLGRDGKKFNIIKFRTMVMDAEDNGPVLATKDDNRVTGIGAFLRRTHIDEIPQLINVLKGDMSIVGPRPERDCFYKEFAEYIDGFEQRLLVPQGITGIAQILGDYDLKPEKKIIYDLFYVKNCNILMDIKIMLNTVVCIFR